MHIYGDIFNEKHNWGIQIGVLWIWWQGYEVSIAFPESIFVFPLALLVTVSIYKMGYFHILIHWWRWAGWFCRCVSCTVIFYCAYWTLWVLSSNHLAVYFIISTALMQRQTRAVIVFYLSYKDKNKMEYCKTPSMTTAIWTSNDILCPF